jgi:hypothetical protein
MTLKELQSGTKFKYGHSRFYTLQESNVGEWIICQFGMYVATVTKMTSRYIYAYTFVMNQKVTLKIDLLDCFDMEQEENKDYPVQEKVNEYGIGAYEEA